MATRSGNVDPGLLTFLLRRENWTPEQLDQLLNGRSGLLGLSGISADVRELVRSTDTLARLALNLYCYRARKYIGAYLAVLGGAEAVVFGGGVGENVPEDAGTNPCRHGLVWNRHRFTRERRCQGIVAYQRRIEPGGGLGYSCK